MFRERRQELPAVSETPLDLSFRVDADAPEELGLRFDWIRIELGEKARVRLAEWMRWKLAAIPLLLWLFFAAMGWKPLEAFAITAPVSLALSVGLLADPWLTYRSAMHLPVAISVVGLGLVVTGRWLAARGVVSGADLRPLAVLLMATFLVRATAVSHPDFYHPDLRTHARFVEIIREGGVDFFQSPSAHILRHGVWKRQAYGREYAFPYSPAFHLPFVPLAIDYDGLVSTMPLVAAAWSIVPMGLIWWLARRTGLSLFGAVLMAFVPTYMSRLSYALMPSLLGHVFDVALVCWIVVRVDKLSAPGIWWRGSLLIAASQLAYTSGVLNSTAFLLALVLLLFVSDPKHPGRWLPLAVWLGVASTISIALFYRDFLAMVFDVMARAGASSSGNESLYPIRGWLELSYERTRAFFDGIYPVLAAAGVWAIARRRGSERFALGAWAVAYLLLLLGRAKMPDLFIRGHEALFVTPLVCVAAGEALSRLRCRGGWKEVLALVLFLALAVQGLVFQWRAMATQLLPTP